MTTEPIKETTTASDAVVLVLSTERYQQLKDALTVAAAAHAEATDMVALDTITELWQLITTQEAS